MDIRAHVVALNESRMRVFNELQAELDATAGRVRNEEEKAKIARLDARIDELDAEVREFVSRETRETESAQLREAQAHIFGEAPKPKAGPNPDAELRSWLRGERRNDVFDEQTKSMVNGYSIDLSKPHQERELIRQGATPEEIRTLVWDTGSIASGVPTTTARSLYEYVTAEIALMQMPTYKFNTASGEQMKFPRVNAHGIGTQVSGQGTTIGGTDPTFLSMTLDAFKYGEVVDVAVETISDTAFPIVDFLTRNIGRAVGEVIGTDLAVGTGSGQPNGVMTAIGGAGTIATGGSLIDPTYEKLIDLQYSVNGNYRRRPSTAWLMRDLTAATLRKLRDGAGGTVGAVLWQPSLTNGIIGAEPDLLLGHPVWTDPNVASLASNAKVIAYGDFSAYYIRTVGNFLLQRDDSIGFKTDLVSFKGKWRVDGDLIDSTAINVMKRSV